MMTAVTHAVRGEMVTTIAVEVGVHALVPLRAIIAHGEMIVVTAMTAAIAAEMTTKKTDGAVPKTAALVPQLHPL